MPDFGSPYTVSLKFNLGDKSYNKNEPHPFNLKSALVNTGIGLLAAGATMLMSRDIKAQTEGLSPVFSEDFKRMNNQLLLNVGASTVGGALLSAFRHEGLQSSIEHGIQAGAAQAAVFGSKMLFAEHYDNTIAASFLNLAHSTVLSAKTNIALGEKPFHRLTYNFGPAYFEFYPKGKDGEGNDKFDFKLDPVDAASSIYHAARYAKSLDLVPTIKIGVPLFIANEKGKEYLHNNEAFALNMGGMILQNTFSGDSYSRERTDAFMTSFSGKNYFVKTEDDFNFVVNGPMKDYYLNNPKLADSPEQNREQYNKRVAELKNSYINFNLTRPDLDVSRHDETDQTKPMSPSMYGKRVNVHESFHTFNTREYSQLLRPFGDYVDEQAYKIKIPEWISFGRNTSTGIDTIHAIADNVVKNKVHHDRFEERSSLSFEQYYLSKQDMLHRHNGGFYDSTKGETFDPKTLKPSGINNHSEILDVGATLNNAGATKDTGIKSFGLNNIDSSISKNPK